MSSNPQKKGPDQKIPWSTGSQQIIRNFPKKVIGGVFAAYTHTGASSMYAALGDGENALKYLNGFADYPLVRRNSLYAESGPVLESPLSAAQCVHDMLLQSWGDKIRIFPAVP